jgi:hypothetical protein
MSFFVIEIKAKVGYVTAAPQGVEALFENLAVSNRLSACSQTLRPSADRTAKTEKQG